MPYHQCHLGSTLWTELEQSWAPLVVEATLDSSTFPGCNPQGLHESKSCSQVSVAWVSPAHQYMFLSLTTLSKVLLALLVSGRERRKNRVKKKKKTDTEILTLNFHLLSNPKSVIHLLFLYPLLSSRLFKTFSRLAQGLVWTIFHYQKKK